MKTRFHIIGNIFFAAILTIAISGCHENGPTPISLITTDNFSTLDHLEIYYDGNRVVGKSADLFQEEKTAYITLYSEVNPAEISEKLSFLPVIKGSGAIPGSPSLTIPVYLKDNGKEFTFSGTGETDYLEYEYNGSVDNSRLNINFTNARLINSSLAGTILEPAGFIPTGTILDDMVKTKFITFGEGKYSIDELMGTIVRTVSFNHDGNIAVTYIKTNTGTPQPALCPLTMLQYVQPADNRLLLYINPTDLAGQIVLNNPYHPTLPDNPFGEQARPRSGEEDEESILTGSVMEELAGAVSIILQKGLPMEYTISGKDIQIYLDLSPVVAAVQKSLAEIPDISPELIQKIEPILVQLGSTKLGFNFHKLQ